MHSTALTTSELLALSLPGLTWTQPTQPSDRTAKRSALSSCHNVSDLATGGHVCYASVSDSRRCRSPTHWVLQLRSSCRPSRRKPHLHHTLGPPLSRRRLLCGRVVESVERYSDDLRQQQNGDACAGHRRRRSLRPHHSALGRRISSRCFPSY